MLQNRRFCKEANMCYVKRNWKNNFFLCCPNFQGHLSFDAGFKTTLQTPLCVSSAIVSYLQPFKTFYFSLRVLALSLNERNN